MTIPTVEELGDNDLMKVCVNQLMNVVGKKGFKITKEPILEPVNIIEQITPLVVGLVADVVKGEIDKLANSFIPEAPKAEVEKDTPPKEIKAK